MTFLNFQLSLDSPRNQIFFFPTLFFVYSMPNRICDVYYIHCVRVCVCVCVCVCMCVCVCLCVWEKKNNNFEIHVILLRYIRNVNLPFKKDLKFAELLTKISLFLYFRGRPKNGKGNKLRRRRKYMRKSN